ncbi:peptidylprolyl isomerase [candidate division KSB1 bacterium]|nr:peptidylprolyl isomerase [candidate division KSB1 bacterium]
MAVMGKMREYTKIFLFVLVVAFIGTIIFDWGMDVTGIKTQNTTIGKINGKALQAQTFYNAYEQEIENMRKRSGVDPSESQLDFLRNQVWENMVRDELVTQEIRKRDLKATDGEVIHYIFDAPPEILKQNPSFQNEKGEFDYGRYQAALRDPNAQLQPFWQSVESYMRGALPYQKFQDLIEASATVTESQVKDEYLKRNQKITVRYVLFLADKYRQTGATVDAKEIEKYYNEHQDEFKEPEKRKIEYVTFSTRPTQRDSQSVHDLAATLKERALSGEDFSELAKKYSEDESNRDKGGDLGFFNRGQMVKPFEEAAFSGQPGDLLGPVQTAFGLHLIKVLEKKNENDGEQVHASHILLKFNASAETISAAKDSANYFAAHAKETTWEETLKLEKLQAQTSTFFPEGTGFVPGIGMNRSASRFIFKNKSGSISDPYEIPQGLLVLRVLETQGEHIKLLEEVKTQIESKLLAERWKQVADQVAGKFYADLMQKGATALDSTTVGDTLNVATTEPFTRSGYVTGIGRDQDFIGAAFALKPGQISKPVKGQRGSYILQLVSQDPFDEVDYTSKKEGIRQQLLDRAKQEAFTQWYADLKEKAKIEDFRENFF